MQEIYIEAGRTERQYWRDLWRYRELFYFLTWRDILVRYKQTVVGASWAVIRPLVTMLVMTIEFAKCLLPWHWWRVVAHGVLGWLLFPLRYLDLWLLRTDRAGRIGNHCYVWLRK